MPVLLHNQSAQSALAHLCFVLAVLAGCDAQQSAAQPVGQAVVLPHQRLQADAAKQHKARQQVVVKQLCDTGPQLLLL